ncbi:MAG: ABC transporter ATP-binding protein [Oscillospiraceae bacterium]|nr:ABC transporter ATP-binding protein [Oscillospiraceae bacterium]
MNAISVKNLTKTYGSVNAVDNISFSVEKGNLIGFLGVNGAGKSTTINMMSTLLEPNSGSIEICGCDIKKDSRKVREKTGIVYQNNVLDDLLTVKENLLCRGMLRCSDKKQALTRLAELEDIFSLTDILKKKYRTLSGGQKRRCEIAAALMHTPEVLILDEPTTGLDPSARREVWSTIEQLRKKTKMTVFLTTHYMEEAAGADKIIIISKVKIVAEGLPHELKEKYAADHLKMYCDNFQKSKLLKNLALSGTKYTDESYGLKISLASTREALPLLDKAGDGFEGFEVIQGTMDDVFLNATKEDIH